jgi:hypothetical protein
MLFDARKTYTLDRGYLSDPRYRLLMEWLRNRPILLNSSTETLHVSPFEALFLLGYFATLSDYVASKCRIEE